jgi:DNA-binding NarL/FixJ family response regulator
MLDTVALRCVIVDDNGEFLEAARQLLGREGLDVVAVASDAAEAVRLVAALQPDVALVDVYLGGEDGFELAPRLMDGNDGVRPAVLLISTYSERDLAELIAASPAAGFLSKSELSGAAVHAALGLDPPP